MDAEDAINELWDTLEQAQAENARLRVALEKLADKYNYRANEDDIEWTDCNSDEFTPWDYARRALGKEE